MSVDQQVRPSATRPFNESDPAVQRFMRDVNTGWKMWLFALVKLPSLVWWGIRVRSLTTQECRTAIPFSWRTQNPFRSTYFAAQSGVAELSTGLLCMLAMAGRAKVSMLITKIEGDYVKKATSTVEFHCEQGAEIIATVDRAFETGEPQVVRVMTVGRQSDGVEVARFYFTWSFRVKE